MANYVLVHGVWHTGANSQGVASPIQAVGHEVLSHTVKGNRPGDSKMTGLSETVDSIVEYPEETGTEDDAILVGHSY